VSETRSEAVAATAWTLASENRHKFSEFAAMFVALPVRLDPLPPGVRLPPEDGDTLLANARLKARAAAESTGGIALADDTGLEVDALGGEPGVRSSRYAGEHASFEDNIRLLLERLHGIHGVNRRARFRCVLVLRDAAGREFTAEGRLEGFITDAPRGGAGFGYDPVFQPEGESRAFAEMNAEEKNAVSHRSRAVARLREVCERLGRWAP
jgi:XTP/dITP diphosphohydrolase